MTVGVARWEDLLAGEEIAYVGMEPPREARTVPLPDDLHPKARAALEAQGVSGLYLHQAEVWETVARGEHVDGHDRHREREVARLQPARARRARPGAEAPRACTSTPPRRSHRTRLER